MSSLLAKYLPAVTWLKSYSLKQLRGDAMAGITVGVMLVPQGMAYALLAGLPPIYGLYAGIVPPLIYMLFGTSPQLSVGPVALVSLIVLSGLSEIAPANDPTAFITLAIATAFLAGLIQTLLGVFRMGFLVNYLSQPVLSGFTSAAAVIIGLSQLGNVMGVSIPRSNYIQDIMYQVYLHFGEISLPTVALSISGIILMLGLKRINKSLPVALIAAILGTSAVAFWGLDQMGIMVVGAVPKGLPAFELPAFNLKTTQDLFSLAVTVCIISFIESLAIAKAIERKHQGNYKIDPNQELIALGLSKLVGGFFQAYPTTGSFTRSAVNDESGAQTGIAALFTSILLALTLIFLTPLFFFLPKAILAAIIIVATISLIDYKKAIQLWRIHRSDFYQLIATFLATLFLGIQVGVMIGVLLSLAAVIYRSSKPQIVELGRIPETNHFRNIYRFPQAEKIEGALIFRFDSQLYFGNAGYFKEKTEQLIKNYDAKLKAVMLDASSIHDMDSTGAQILEELVDFTHSRGAEFYSIGCIGPIRDFMEKSGLMQKIGKNHLFLNVQSALDYYKKASDRESLIQPFASQTNRPSS